MVTQIYNSISSAINGFLNIVNYAVQVLNDMSTGLDTIDDYVVSMSSLQVTHGDAVLPIVQAVATLKYMVPTDVFYVFYLLLSFGVLFTLYKIISLIISSIKNMIANTTTSFSGAGILEKITSIFR